MTDFRLALLSTAAGNFSVNNNESPEAVRDISKLREGDSLEIEMMAPFGYNKRQNPQGGDDIIDVSCTKFRIITAEAGEETKIMLEGNTKIKSKYSVEYLKKMIQGAKLSDRVKIQFNHDYPLKIEYNAIDRVLLSFILAPRVEND